LSSGKYDRKVEKLWFTQLITGRFLCVLPALVCTLCLVTAGLHSSISCLSAELKTKQRQKSCRSRALFPKHFINARLRFSCVSVRQQVE